MKKLIAVLLLSVTAAPLAGCYVYPAPVVVRPAYVRPAPPPWVPGHFTPYGRWIPGHYA